MKLLQNIANAERDSPPNQRELELFWFEMDSWRLLDSRLVSAIVHIVNEVQGMDAVGARTDFLKKMVVMENMANGVRNCLTHVIGSMVRTMIGSNNEQIVLEDIVSDVQGLAYQEYRELLEGCGCDECNSVVDFDDNYRRYVLNNVLHVRFYKQES